MDARTEVGKSWENKNSGAKRIKTDRPTSEYDTPVRIKSEYTTIGSIVAIDSKNVKVEPTNEESVPSAAPRKIGLDSFPPVETFIAELELESSESHETAGMIVRPPSPKSRLLLKDWLKQQVSEGKTPGLCWLDESQSLIRIPWIHASKGCWEKDFHCKLFENWAVYSGKHRKGIDKDCPKRWKANFRCALNSLPDVKEETEMSQRNGKDGYKVYRLCEDTNVPRVCKREMKRQSKKAHSVSSTSLEGVQLEANCNYQNNNYENPQPSYIVFKNIAVVIPTSGLTGPGPIIAPNTELINDTVCAWDTSSFTSIINDDICVNEVTVTTDADEEVACHDNVEVIVEENVTDQLSTEDHSYFKTQIPTTVEEFRDDDQKEEPEDPPQTSAPSPIKRSRRSSTKAVSPSPTKS